MNKLIYLTENEYEMANKVGNIIGYASLVAAIIFGILMIIAAIQVKNERKQWYETLDDHDKAIILKYKSFDRSLPRRSKKK